MPPRTRKSHARWANLALLAVIGAALIAGLFFAFQTIEAERTEREQVRRTNEVLLELRSLSSAALNAETGQRGYLITLDRRYLQPYLQGREEYRPTLARLRALIGDEATVRQAALLDEIDTLTAAKFAEMGESVQLLQNAQLLDARRKVLSDEGQEVMTRLRQAIHEMETIESQLLDEAANHTAEAESRVLPLLSGVMALLLVALIMGYLLVVRTARAEAQAHQAAALREARDRADLLARELNHRVKNLFAVALAIVQMSGRDDPDAQPVVGRISERIRALLTAHEVTQGTSGQPVGSLRALVETTLAPYRSENTRADISGPEILLPEKQVTPLGLVLHELTTNAVKYGAWAKDGVVSVDWRVDDGSVVLDWWEHGLAFSGEPEHKGFGSMLMVSAARQLGGTIERSFDAQGLHVRIEIAYHA